MMMVMVMIAGNIYITLSTSQTLTHFIFRNTLWGRYHYYHSHFTDQETKVQSLIIDSHTLVSDGVRIQIHSLWLCCLCS